MSCAPTESPSSEPARFEPTRRKPGRGLVRWLTVIVVLSYVAVAFGRLWPQDFRNTAPWYVMIATAAFMIRTFLFHLGLALVAVAAGLALLRRWRLVLATLPLLALTLGPDLWSYMPRRRPAASGESLTIVSANLLALNHDTQPITRRIAQIGPDVVVLQEYAPQWDAAFRRALGSAYPYRQAVVRRDSFGLAIYSKQPLAEPVETHVRLGAGTTPEFRAVLRLGGRRVALYDVHLMPPIGLAYTTEQRVQFADLLDRLRAERLPIILCGDFNFTNRSAYADALERLGLVDAHRISGRGRGATWPARGLLRLAPGIRLDHIFLSRELTSTASRVLPIRGSDHRAIMARVSLRAAGGPEPTGSAGGANGAAAVSLRRRASEAPRR